MDKIFMVDIVKQKFKENKQLYSQIEKVLKSNLGNDYPITHVGSTAIPNMYGKNIIDILIGVKNSDGFEEVSNKLVSIGYYVSKKNKDTIYKFFSSSDCETKSGDIHIHLVIMETERYKEFIILKDYLLCNKKEALKYSDFKKMMIKKGISDRKEYKSVKSEYVSSLIERAKIIINNDE